MRYFQDHPDLVGETLQFPQPQASARTITAAAVRRDQQSRLEKTITLALRQPLPPATDRSHSKFGRVVTNPHGHASVIVGQVIDAIRNSLCPVPCPESRATLPASAGLYGGTFSLDFSCFPGVLSSSYRWKSPGSSLRCRAFTRRAMCSNWALRSGCCFCLQGSSGLPVGCNLVTSGALRLWCC